jgi:hypothetical protein
MPLLPHPPLYLAQVRPLDVLLLLAAGAAWEALARTVLLLSCKRKPASVRRQEEAWEQLNYETIEKRKIGISAFVETSKLERQVLALERALEATRESRKVRQEQVERFLLRYGNIAWSLLIFVLYYGVALVSLEPLEQEFGSRGYASPPLRSMLFPVSYMGLGMRVARLGLDDAGVNSIGALVVFWSSQVVTSKVFDGVDSYCVV